ncbi:MAG: nucleotidyltransferase family protein, partial [Proteobacteria bacterium]|nr:nucleotidyltransferase family protein [Pseudomonadota bacterium]
MTPVVPISTARPEHALILAAAAPATDAAGRARLALLLQGPIDWTHVVETTDRHAVTALVLRRLADAATQLLPPELVEASEVYIARQRDTNQRLVAELVRIVRALSQQGIAVMPFKGPVLAELAYGDVALRQFRDLDFLVHEADVDRALAVVEALGYIVASPLSPVQEGAFRRYAGQYIFWRADGDAPIEPHWAFAPRSLAVDLDYAGLWQRAVPVRLAGIELRCLAPADLIAVLCIHGSKEEWTRLQWICDIAQTLQSFPDIDWAVVLDRARRHGHLRMVLIGLALARSFLGSQIPPAIGGVLASDP